MRHKADTKYPSNCMIILWSEPLYDTMRKTEPVQHLFLAEFKQYGKDPAESDDCNN